MLCLASRVLREHCICNKWEERCGGGVGVWMQGVGPCEAGANALWVWALANPPSKE